MAVYRGSFDCDADIIRDFEISEADFVGVSILYASYQTGNYEGDAFVLFERDGKMYEVHGSHCSCYGLEGQWEPEETTEQDILFRLDKGGYIHYGDKSADEEVRSILESRKG